jgi:hypothetical protein
MPGVRRAMEQITRLRDNLPQIAEDSVAQVKPSIVEAQAEQLVSGSNADGGTFRRYKDPRYAKMKNTLNPLPGLGNPDLKLTGAFHKGIYATVQDGRIVIGSSDNKAQWLEPNYKSIFGLNPQEMEDFLYGKLKPVYHQNILNSLKY